MDSNKKVPLFNPLKKDFEYEWLDSNNTPHILSIPAREIAYFDHIHVDFMVKHLSDAVYNEREHHKSNASMEYEEIIKEIRVNV